MELVRNAGELSLQREVISALISKSNLLISPPAFIHKVTVWDFSTAEMFAFS